MARKLPEGVHKSTSYTVSTPTLIQVMKGFNARKRFRGLQQLATDIKENGLYDPLWVRKDRANEKCPYILIDGERRLRALQQIFQEDPKFDIRILLRIFDVNEEQAEDMMAKSFLQREDLSTSEMIGLVQRYRTRGVEVKDIAERFSCSPSWVDQMLTLASASSVVLKAVDGGKITISAALLVARKKKAAAQESSVARIIAAAGGERRKTTRAAARDTGTLVRPGKKELRKVVLALSSKEVEDDAIQLSTARELVMMALSYAAGESDRTALLEACAEKLCLSRPEEETPTEASSAPEETQAAAPQTLMPEEVEPAVPSGMAGLLEDDEED